MSSIKFYIALFIFIFPISTYADSDKEVSAGINKIKSISSYPDNDKETSTGINNVKSIIDTSWNKNIKPLTNIAEKKWTSLLTSTTTNSKKLKKAVSGTWNKVLGDTQAGNEISDAGSAISSFIIHEINDTTESTTHSAKLIENGKLVDGIWYLSTRLIKDADTNLANAVQESELLNTLGRITATSYGGSQGAAVYASWYALKQANKPYLKK
jgi:hypothetical protein